MAIKLTLKTVYAVAISMRQFKTDKQIINALAGKSQIFYRVYGGTSVTCVASSQVTVWHGWVGIHTGELPEWVGDMQNSPGKGVFTDKKKAERFALYCRKHDFKWDGSL